MPCNWLDNFWETDKIDCYVGDKTSGINISIGIKYIHIAKHIC